MHDHPLAQDDLIERLRRSQPPDPAPSRLTEPLERLEASIFDDLRPETGERARLNARRRESAA